MPKITLNYRSNERRRLGRPLKRLLDEAETGLSGSKLWRFMMMMMMMMMMGTMWKWLDMIQLHSVLVSARATVNDKETAESMNPAKIRATHIPNSSDTATVTCVDNVSWSLQYLWTPPSPSEWLSVRWRDFWMTADIRSRSRDLKKWRRLMKLKTAGRINRCLLQG
jgi:hypothetical protein